MNQPTKRKSRWLGTGIVLLLLLAGIGWLFGGQSQLPDKLRNIVAFDKLATHQLVFHGRVVDQNGKGVDGVKLPYTISSLFQLGDSTIQGEATTDSFGNFLIEGSGYTLSLRLSRTPELTDHQMPRPDGTHRLTGSFQPLEDHVYDDWRKYTASNPYTIRVWRQPEAEYGDVYKTSRAYLKLTIDGEPVGLKRGEDHRRWVYSSRIKPSTILTFSCTREPESPDWREGGDWTITITALDGGIQEASGEFFANMAPESGYDRASITVGSKRSDPDFHKELKGKRYFFTARNGRIHGVIEADFVPYRSPDNCKIFREIRLTEDGSRNLAVRR